VHELLVQDTSEAAPQIDEAWSIAPSLADTADSRTALRAEEFALCVRCSRRHGEYVAGPHTRRALEASREKLDSRFNLADPLGL